MKRKKGGKSSPIAVIIGILAVIWLLKNFNTLFAILAGVVILGIAALLFFIIRSAVKSSNDDTPKKKPVDVTTKGEFQKKVEENPTPKPAPKKEPEYSPEVQAVVDEGKRAHVELEHLYATIPDLSVKAKIRELINVSDKIIEDAVNDPSDVPQIKKFLDYYLPTTIKLLNAYDRMGSQGIEGDNISGTMQSINEMLDTSVAAYKKLLDSLFANQALDVETDIEVMNTLMKREGLTGGTTAVSGKL